MSIADLPRKVRPELSFWQIWNMCFGFMGIQFGFALQIANVSRIFQTLGAQIEDIPMWWVAAPLTGLIVQPIVGYLSDRTWTRLGRRRPFFLVGALLASTALIFMPNSPTLWIAAGLLWVLDASINVSMEPFRAFVGDQMPPHQRASGYAMQSFFIGVGAVVASALPWMFTQAGVSNIAEAGVVPDAVRYAFYCGAVALLLAVGWTIVSTKEMPPDELKATDSTQRSPQRAVDQVRANTLGLIFVTAGILAAICVWRFGLDRQLYLLAGMVLAYGIALLWLARRPAKGMFSTIMSDLYTMPDVMRQLALVQFFSWFALFAMWSYTTPAVAQVHFGSSDPTSAAYNNGADWVGVLVAAYNGFAVLAAMVIPWLVRRLGLGLSHMLNLWLGAAGFASFLLVDDPQWLLLSMVGIGFAWASILSLPYALLADSLPAEKMGIYMGIFNLFIVIPQLVAASVLGFLLKSFFGMQPIHALTIAAVSLVLAGLFVLRVKIEQPAPAHVAVQP